MRVRERILDGVAALVERSGFDAVTMAAAAREAEVSRQTVYTHFGSREDLLTEALTRTTSQMLERVNSQVEAVSQAPERVVELVVAVRAEFRRQPVLGALLFARAGNPLFDEELFSRAGPIAARLLAPILVTEPRLAERYGDTVEIIMRFGLSILLFTSDAVRTDDDLRAFLHRSLVPALGL
jgi:AcrR family transcriptional regulator